MFDFFAHESEIGNHFVERFALPGVSDGVLQRNASAAHAHRAQLEAADVEDVECDQVALAGFAEQVLCGDFTVVQNDRAG
jgi:hypothetical protein